MGSTIRLPQTNVMKTRNGAEDIEKMSQWADMIPTVTVKAAQNY